MAGVDAVHVVGELGEAVHVLPHALVGGVEEVGAVAVHLDARALLVLAVGVAAQVRPPVDHRDLQTQLARGPFGHGETEKPRAHHHKISVHLSLLPSSTFHARTSSALKIPDQATRALCDPLAVACRVPDITPGRGAARDFPGRCRPVPGHRPGVGTAVGRGVVPRRDVVVQTGAHRAPNMPPG